MANSRRVVMFFTGLGMGAAGAILFAPVPGRRARRQLRCSVGRASAYVRDQAEAIEGKVSKGINSVSHLTERVKDTVDDVAATAKMAADTIVDQSRDVVHDAGKKLTEGGKRLQRV